MNKLMVVILLAAACLVGCKKDGNQDFDGCIDLKSHTTYQDDQGRTWSKCKYEDGRTLNRPGLGCKSCK